MHKASHQPVLDDLKKIRESRRNAAVAEYRQAVEVISSGDVEPAELGAGLDDVMLRLSITDTDLATDVEVLREHQECRARLSAFEPQRSEVQKRRDEAKAKVKRLEKEYESWTMRHAHAQAMVQEIGAPMAVAKRDTLRVAKLENDSPRLFDSQDPTLPGTTGSVWGVGDPEQRADG